MTSTFKALQYCDKKSRNTVNGYIYDTQRLFPWKQNSYYIIPDIVIHLCLSYFWNAGIFNLEKHGKYLKFIDPKTVQKENESDYSICTVGDVITDEMCDIFRIEYQIKKQGENNDFCPYIGYFIKGIQEIENSVDYNYCPGAGKNIKISVGIAIHKTDANYLLLYDKDKSNERLHLKKDSKLKAGDRFMLEFNFKKAQCDLYYNGEEIHKLELKTKIILPALSLYFVGEVVEITKYEFDYL